MRRTSGTTATGSSGGALPEEVAEAIRDLSVHLALELGFFPEVDSPWLSPLPTQIVYADGTWISAASLVKSLEQSRSKHGRPRVVQVGDHNGKLYGYNICLLAVRSQGARRRLILDLIRSEGGDEMTPVIDRLEALRSKLGIGGFRASVYDGAMRGVHHRRLRSGGTMTINKPSAPLSSGTGSGNPKSASPLPSSPSLTAVRTRIS